MKLLEAVKLDRPYWRWMLLLVLLGVVSGAVYAGYQVLFGCARVHASAPPDRLEVKRIIVAPGASPSQVPGDWMFGASQAQEVLAAIDSLPASPAGTRFCALADATVYGLGYIFLRGSTIVLQASAPEGGCHVLNLSGCDTRQEDGNFLLLMEQLLHLSKI